MELKLSISNIAWPKEIRHEIYALLSRNGVTGIEVAPTKIAPWDDLTELVLMAERDLMATFGLKVSSYQALYFGCPGLALLEDESAFEALLKHTVRVARVSERLSHGGAGVFGAPRNRLRGRLGEPEAFDLGAERFLRLAEAVSSYGFTIMLEPAPPEYGGDFLRTEQECAAMVQQVAHRAFQLHVDTGCLTLANEDGLQIVTEYHDLIGHVHLSQPSLVPLEMSAVPTYTNFLRSLREVAYSGWTAIEMRETEEPIQAVDAAIRTIQAAMIESLE